jgi:CubicO group peptidase (beta-lactamase class C family)
MIEKLKEFFNDAIEKKVFPGCAAAVVVRGREPQIITEGHFTYDKNSPQIKSDSVFDTASVTKAIPVSCLALKLIESGMMKRNDLLVKYVPLYKSNYSDSVTIDNLLTQTLDFSFRLSQCKDLGSQGILDTILSADLNSAPGTKYSYANATSILLGLAIETCTNSRLDKLAEELLFKPLKMKTSTFFPENLDKSIVVPTEFDNWRGRLLWGEIHDESAWALRPLVIAGSAGLFSTAKDLSRFVSMLIGEGCIDGVKIFNPETVKLMHTNQRPLSSGEWTGLGWELNQGNFMGKYRSVNTFGKTGFTGCSVVIDPCKNAGIVLLTNHVHPTRGNDRSAINRVRSAFADEVFGSIQST